MSLVLNPDAKHMSPQFDIVRDDSFQTVSSSGANSLPPNWKEMFNVNHCSDDENFKSPLEAKIDDKSKAVRVHFSNKTDEVSNDNDTVNPLTTVSEGDEE